MGSGHLMRCLSLAASWPEGSVILRSHGLTSGLRSTAIELGVRVVDADSSGDERDASDTARLASSAGALLVVDGYHLGADLRRSALDTGVPVCWIDDGGWADDPVATVVVNQNLAATPAWYPEARADQHVLAGPRYALLRPAFSALGDAPEPTRPRVVVTFGGSDPGDWSRRVLTAIADAQVDLRASAEIDLVIGGDVRGAAELSAYATACGVRVLRNVRSMAEVLSAATVVLSAAGTTVLEVACVGRAAVLVAVAENQRPVARAARDSGIAVECFTAREAVDEVGALLADPVRRLGMAHRGRSLVDGGGANRVAATLSAL